MNIDVTHLNHSPTLAVARSPDHNWLFNSVAEASRHYANTQGEKNCLHFDNEPDLNHWSLDLMADQLAYRNSPWLATGSFI